MLGTAFTVLAILDFYNRSYSLGFESVVSDFSTVRAGGHFLTLTRLLISRGCERLCAHKMPVSAGM